MKKLLILSALCLSVSLLFACNGQPALMKNVSELVECVWQAESDDYVVKAQYGYCETPYVPDGTVGKLSYGLTLRLTPKTAELNAEYRATLTLGETPYEVVFTLDPVRHKLSAVVPTEERPPERFAVKITRAETEDNLELVSQLPEDMLSPAQALEALETNQGDLLNSYRANGVFDAEITLRAFVNKDHPYWYVGLVRGEHKVVALLIDGVTGEVLAIRELY